MRVAGHPRRFPGAEELLLEREGVTRTGRRIETLGPSDVSDARFYFAGAAGANLVKLGWAIRPSRVQQCIAELETYCPYPVLLLHTVGPASRSDKPRLLKRFTAQHFHGDWFRWEGDLRAFLEEAQRDPEGANAELLASVAKRPLTMSMD